jgi:hypothetical protein
MAGDSSALRSQSVAAPAPLGTRVSNQGGWPARNVTCSEQPPLYDGADDVDDGEDDDDDDDDLDLQDALAAVAHWSPEGEGGDGREGVAGLDGVRSVAANLLAAVALDTPAPTLLAGHPGRLMLRGLVRITRGRGGAGAVERTAAARALWSLSASGGDGAAYVEQTEGAVAALATLLGSRWSTVSSSAPHSQSAAATSDDGGGRPGSTNRAPRPGPSPTKATTRTLNLKARTLRPFT